MKKAKPIAMEPLQLDFGASQRRPKVRLSGAPGILPRQVISGLQDLKILQATAPFDLSQFQPASLDLRLGARAYRVEASFLPGASSTVEDKLRSLKPDIIDLSKEAILEKDRIYVVELMEYLNLPKNVVALANPKSSTGRIDIFTRLITDYCVTFDSVPTSYNGRLYLEVSPRSFGVRVRQGTRLNQIRFRRLNSNQRTKDFHLTDKEIRTENTTTPLVDGGEINLRRGLVLSIDLSGDRSRIVGYRAKKSTRIIDFDNIAGELSEDFWDPIYARRNARLILELGEFYILMSKEKIHIPPMFAAEMIPIDPAMGEFRVHYAGFFDPGFGHSTEGYPGARAVMEVRSHEVPFNLEDGQMVCRLAFEKMAERPDALYGAIGTSNYQGQELKLSKQFRTE